MASCKKCKYVKVPLWGEWKCKANKVRASYDNIKGKWVGGYLMPCRVINAEGKCAKFQIASSGYQPMPSMVYDPGCPTGTLDPDCPPTGWDV